MPARNLGFGPGANLGFRHFLAQRRRGREWIALAPHDALPEPDCLRRMLDALRANGLEPGWPAPTSATAPRRSSIRTSAASSRRRTVAEGWEPAGHPHGTLMLARRACLEEVGLFDERYFAYCEEADLALRAAAAGWECGLVRGAMVRNPYVGSASAAIDYLQLRNTLLLVREHSGRYHAFIRYVHRDVAPGVGRGVPVPAAVPTGTSEGRVRRARRLRPRPVRPAAPPVDPSDAHALMSPCSAAAMRGRTIAEVVRRRSAGRRPR